MNNNEIISKLLKMDLTNIKVVSSLLDMAINTENAKLGIKVRDICAINTKKVPQKALEFQELYKNALLFCAPEDFDSYMLYMEIGRSPKERFYQPRRKILKRAVEQLQRLADDELDELFLSMPPRVGKTTLLLFFLTWIIGRDG
mgnify:CR=1 FL=1